MERLPPELIESIIDTLVDGIDQDAWICDRSPAIPVALRALALVARGFARRCQTRIFFGITVGGYACIPPPRLSALLTESPHLASYIRALYFGSVVQINESMAASVAHILSSVTNLGAPCAQSSGIWPPSTRARARGVSTRIHSAESAPAFPRCFSIRGLARVTGVPWRVQEPQVAHDVRRSI
ncbi:hypothetical protein DFH06DRAFT_1185879 [Mycena polygramma]|nr:hypothetical protein DFH06DRAFT_1185879 [Mycena polygramma]